MKRIAHIALIAMLASSLVSCVFPGYKLKPGDKIGDMELTTSFDKNIHEFCTFMELSEGACEIPLSVSTIGVSTGWAEDTLEELDLSWLDSKWKMTIDGHEVNLPAFGTFDLDFEGQKARVWAVGVTNIALGEHTVRYDFHFDNGFRKGNHGLTYIFTVVATDSTQPSLMPTGPTSQPIEGVINPGDKIGDFLITTGGGKDITYVWNLHSECVKQGGVENYSCKVNTDTKMNVSWGVYASINTDLDTMWSEHTYKMFINDRPVNLEAFGSIDVRHPTVGPMRHWNVVIVASKPGEITVHTEAVVDGEPSEDTKTFTFSAP